MQPIHDFDDRFLILRSLIRRKELPEDWYKDSNYEVRFESGEHSIERVVITLKQQHQTIIREYEPMMSKDNTDAQTMFMLKTSELQHHSEDRE